MPDNALTDTPVPPPPADTVAYGFGARLKRAVTGDASTPLVFLGNFEVEEEWARGEAGLPRVSAEGGVAVVNRMDEFALLLGGEDDHVVLKSAPDPDYLDHLRRLGLGLPTVHVVREQVPAHTVTRDALADPGLLATLRRLGARGARLLPHGASAPEEELAERAGIALAVPGAAVAKPVNSKVYSRRTADLLGLRQPRGWGCTTLDELDTAVEAASALLDAGRTVLVKEAYGVSGKGIAEVTESRRLARLRTMIGRSARKSGTDRIAFVIEEKVAKRADLNYQFTLAGDGSVHLDFVKEALTEAGVHKGHRFPPALSARQLDEIGTAARLLGGQLAADGFYGVVGVDAMVDPEGGLYPVIEINARNNMSTYQTRLQEHLVGPGRCALARHHQLLLGEELDFAAVRRLLGDLLLGRPDGSGFVVNNFATVNAGATAEGPHHGRLYGLLVADSPSRLAALDAAVQERVRHLGPHRSEGNRHDH
ncbi:preATP grasp domain-containing protein [Streptomyces olivaceus]